jgi:hypothetical protein
MRLPRPRIRTAPGNADEPRRGPRYASSDGLRAAGARLAHDLEDLAGKLRVLVARPVELWLRAAEAAGDLVLGAWDIAVLPVVDAGLSIMGRAVRLAQRIATPVRVLGLVALVAAVAMAGSQFADYRAVELDAPAYRGLQDVAPAPRRDVETPRAAHGLAILAIAGAAMLVTAFALGRNRRLARLLVALGAGGIAVSLLIDLPQGLREGPVAISYEGAEAVLLGAFWVQLSAAVTLAVVGPLLAVQSQGVGAPRASRRNRRRSRSRAPMVDTGLGSAGSGAAEPGT